MMSSAVEWSACQHKCSKWTEGGVRNVDEEIVEIIQEKAYDQKGEKV